MSRILLSYLRKFPLDYGKSAIARRVKVPAEKEFEFTTAEGIRMCLDLREYQMKQIYLYAWYEKNTFRHLLRLIRPQWTVMDVGANVGFYSLTLAKHLPAGEVHAFEPNPRTLTLLKRNLALNQFPNIRLNETGLSDRPGEMTLHFNEENLGAASAFKSSDAQQVVVPLTTLDEYCERTKVNRVDLIKVDIEGAELNFLRGAKETFARNREMVLVAEIVDENCRRAGYTGKELYAYITAMGFKGFIPRSWPFGLKQVEQFPENFHDNILFIRK